MTRQTKFRTADELKAAGATIAEIAREGQAVWARMSELVEAGEKAWTADDRREYDALEKVYDSIVALPEMQYVDRTGVVAPDGNSKPAKYRTEAPLAQSQTFAGYVEAMGHRPVYEVSDALEAEGRDLNFGKFLHGAFTGDWRDARPEQILNALSGATSGAGGVMLPTVLTAEIIDLARKRTRVLEAGARTVPMENRTVDVPRWLTDPTLSWRAENAAIAESDPTMDKITLTAKSLAAVTKVSRELVEDTNVDDQLKAAFAAALSISVDTAALYGSGTGAEPTGVKNHASVTKTSLGTNGATPTWDNLVDSVGRLRDNNEEPTAQILSDRTARALAKTKASDSQYIGPPDYLDGIPRYSTAQIPNNLTVGTSTDTSDIFTADWTQLLIGVRTDLQITLLTERYMPDAGQYGFVAWWRGDIAVARPKAFDVVTGARAF